MRKWIFVVLCLLLALSAEAQARYFSSPKQAVETINELLQKSDWRTLSGYYDLSVPLKTDDGSEITLELLESGKYFFCFDCPPSSSQLNNRYINPFPPGLKYEKNRPSSEPTVVIVTVGRVVDLGDDNKQKLSQDIYLRRTDKGFQLLPSEFAYYTPQEQVQQQQ